MFFGSGLISCLRASTNLYNSYSESILPRPLTNTNSISTAQFLTAVGKASIDVLVVRLGGMASTISKIEIED